MMYAIIRIKSFYEWLWSWMPFVSQRSYLKVCKIAANYHDDGLRDRADLIDLQDVLAKERVARQQAEQRVRDLNNTGDSLRRRLTEEESQCSRLAQLLREVNRVSDSKNLHPPVIKERS